MIDMVSWYFRWRERRLCFHGAPGGGVSYVDSLMHVDGGRKLWECRTQRGGCGKRWVL